MKKFGIRNLSLSIALLCGFSTGIMAAPIHETEPEVEAIMCLQDGSVEKCQACCNEQHYRAQKNCSQSGGNFAECMERPNQIWEFCVDTCEILPSVPDYNIFDF